MKKVNRQGVIEISEGKIVHYSANDLGDTITDFDLQPDGKTYHMTTKVSGTMVQDSIVHPSRLKQFAAEFALKEDGRQNFLGPRRESTNAIIIRNNGAEICNTSIDMVNNFITIFSNPLAVSKRELDKIV